MSLKGAPELRARLKAIKLSFKPIGKQWADDTAEEARKRVPSRTGRLRKSIRRRNATQRKATVVGHYTANFIDAGTKAHTIRAKGKRLRFTDGGRTVFAKKVEHPRTAARPFKKASAEAALRKHPMAQTLIDEWNRAA